MNLRVVFALLVAVTILVYGAAITFSAITVHAWLDALFIVATLVAIMYGLISDAPEPGRK